MQVLQYRGKALSRPGSFGLPCEALDECICGFGTFWDSIALKCIFASSGNDSYALAVRQFHMPPAALQQRCAPAHERRHLWWFCTRRLAADMPGSHCTQLKDKEPARAWRSTFSRVLWALLVLQDGLTCKLPPEFDGKVDREVMKKAACISCSSALALNSMNLDAF